MACFSAVKGVNGVPCLKPSVSESWLRQFFSVACDASPTCHICASTTQGLLPHLPQRSIWGINSNVLRESMHSKTCLDHKLVQSTQ
eukprot:1157641-Pelagomonas_calceolata.AAC.5